MRATSPTEPLVPSHVVKRSRGLWLALCTYGADMSCEAVTAGLVLTGLVHADPHEGNIMLADDGRLVFLDFGLMSEVDEKIMEAFACTLYCAPSEPGSRPWGPTTQPRSHLMASCSLSLACVWWGSGHPVRPVEGL